MGTPGDEGVAGADGGTGGGVSGGVAVTLSRSSRPATVKSEASVCGTRLRQPCIDKEESLDSFWRFTTLGNDRFFKLLF